MAFFNVATNKGDKKNLLIVRGTVSHDVNVDIAGIVFQNYDADDAKVHDMMSISAIDHYGDTTRNGFGDFCIKTNSSGGFHTLTEKMRVTCEGLVGIGTSCPSNTLSVNGTISSSVWNSSSVLIVDGNNVAVSSAITVDELNTLSGISDNVQNQLDVLSNNLAYVATYGGGGSGGGGAGIPQYTAGMAMITDGNGYASASATTATELGYVSGVTSSIQTQLNNLQPLITGAASSIVSSTLPTHAVVVTDASGTISSSATTATEIGYVRGLTSAVQTQLNAKQATLTGAVTSYVSSNATPSRALVSDASGKLTVSATTSTELGYVSGVTSAIQTQLNGLQPLITGAASSIVVSALPTSVVVVTDASGTISSSSTTATEIGYVRGLTSAVQTQLNAKQATLTGAVTSYLSSNAAPSMAVATDASGKLTVSATTATEIGYVSGVTSSIQAQLNAQNIWSASNGNAYYSAGNVGVNTVTPTVPLHVNGVIMGSSLQLSGSTTAGAPGFTFNGNSNMGMYAAAANTLAFSTLGTERARFTSNGYMGIGIVPTAPLHVVTGVSVSSLGSSRYFNTGSGSALLSSSSYTATISIASESSVWVKNGWSFIASSDQRIKKEIARADVSNVASIFDNVNLYTYQYIDDADVGSNNVHGFIAQEVQQYFPEAVEVHSQAVPNVYCLSTTVRWHDQTRTQLQITVPKSTTLAIGDKVQYYKRYSDAPVTATVLSIATAEATTIIVVDTMDPASADASDQVFVYGKVVDDFLTLDKNKLLGLCYGKVKALSDQMARMQTQLDALSG